LFTRFSIGLFTLCLEELGVQKRNKYDTTTMEEIIQYGERLGFRPELILQAYNKFIIDWKKSNEGNLLWSPITYVLKYHNYDGVCNFAANNNAGGSILLQDINPRKRGSSDSSVLESNLGVKHKKSKKKHSKRKSKRKNSKCI
jgi:hypothetical protein